jgi:hypothetical protein
VTGIGVLDVRMDSTTREPVPIRAYGCPEGRAPVSMVASFDGMRGRYDTCPVALECRLLDVW